MSELRATSEGRPWLTFSVLAVGIGVVVVGASTVNVALTSIGEDLDLSPADLAWVVDAYLIAFAGLLLVAGRVGDLVGRRTVFLAGLGVFAAASAICGLAHTGEMLFVGRLLQGAGGAMTAAVTLGMVTSLFQDRRRHARAIGIYVAVLASGASCGLLLGGVLADLAGWRWVFLVNVPVALGTVAGAVKTLRRDRRRGRLVEVAGAKAVIVTAGLMATVYGILAASEHRWDAVNPWIWCASGGVALAYFAWREIRSTTPLIPQVVWRHRSLRAASVVLLLVVLPLSGFSFLGVLYLRTVLTYDAREAGLAFLPLVVSYGGLSMLVPAKSLSAARMLVRLCAGLALVGAGLVVFSLAGVHASYVADVLPGMMLMGLGSGLVIPPVFAVAMAAATDDDAGVRSAIVNTAIQLGAALGVALLTAVAATRSAQLERAGRVVKEALVEGYQLAYMIGAVIVGMACVAAVGLVRAGNGRR